jgi:hypothetical protein
LACAIQLLGLRDALRAVPTDDLTTWSSVARGTAGVIAAWSLRAESAPGPLASITRNVARTAAIRRSALTSERQSIDLSALGSAARLMSAHGSGATRDAELAYCLRDLTAEIRRIHAERGEVQRSLELDDAVVGLGEIAGDLLRAP